MFVVQLLDPALVLFVLDSDVLEQKNLVVLGAHTPATTSRTISFVTKGSHSEDLLDLQFLVGHRGNLDSAQRLDRRDAAALKAHSTVKTGKVVLKALTGLE